MDAKPILPLKLSLVSLALGIGALVVTITAVIIYLVVAGVNQNVVRQSEVYRLAAQQIESHADVALAAGQPVSLGQPECILVFTNLADFGQANFSIPVSGSHRSGSANVIAEKRDGAWVLTQLMVTIQGHPTQIDVLKPGMNPLRGL